MDDLTDIQNNWLIVEVSRTKDTTHLIKWLRDGGEVKPELASFIADILSGKIKASPKKPKITNSSYRFIVRVYLSYNQRVLTEFKKHFLEYPADEPEITFDENHKVSWSELKNRLDRSGYKGETQTKGEITKAAKYLTAHELCITPSQLDEIIIKRKRKK